MRSAIIKKARQDEIQNKKQQQTLITSQTLCSLKKLNNKVKMASDKTETKENNLYLF